MDAEERTLIDAADLAADDAKARDALAKYTLSLVRSEDDPTFQAAFDVLDAEFGAQGELETKAAVIGYLRAASRAAGYRLVVAKDEGGEIAAVRDCHVSVDPDRPLVVVFLSHVVVLPRHRRSGLATLLREVPVVLGRRTVAELTTANGVSPDLVLAAEMEPVTEDEKTRVRLLVYGRAGFRIIDPRILPYSQPDYRAHAIIDADRLRPVALLAVVRWVGHETAHALPKPLAAAFVEHLYRIVGTHCRRADLDPLRAYTLGRLARHPGETVPLLRAPQSLDDAAALAPLSRDLVLTYHRSP